MLRLPSSHRCFYLLLLPGRSLPLVLLQIHIYGTGRAPLMARTPPHTPQIHIYGTGRAPLMARTPYDQFLTSDFKEVMHDFNM